MLRSEVEMLRVKCKHLLEENRRLKQASITIVSIHVLPMYGSDGVCKLPAWGYYAI